MINNAARNLFNILVSLISNKRLFRHELYYIRFELLTEMHQRVDRSDRFDDFISIKLKYFSRLAALPKICICKSH